MGNIFMNYQKTKISDSRRLLFNLADKMNLKRKDKYVALSNLTIYFIWKNIKINFSSDMK